MTSFLGQVAERLENEILEKERMRKKLERVKAELNEYREKDHILKETLIAAQKFSQEIKGNAKRDGELVVKEAELRADEIITRALNRQNNLTEEIRNLKFKRRDAENEILNMLNAVKDVIETYRKDDEDFEKIEYLGKKAHDIG